jgi:hypothetical protein
MTNAVILFTAYSFFVRNQSGRRRRRLFFSTRQSPDWVWYLTRISGFWFIVSDFRFMENRSAKHKPETRDQEPTLTVALILGLLVFNYCSIK